MRFVSVTHRSLAEALSLAPALVEIVERSAQPVCAGSCFSEPAIVLGALQVAGRVLADPAEAGIFRRTTTGTAAHFGAGGVVFTLALPSIDTVFRDATSATILNRNLRLFLAGFASANVSAAYFGREWIAHKHGPFGLVGLDVTASGVLLLEVLVSLEGSLALPRDRVTDLEASCDRYRQKRGIGLVDVSKLQPISFAERVIEGIAERVGSALVATPTPPLLPPAERRVSSRKSPLAESCELGVPQAIPIGYLDVATSPEGKLFVGGDILGSTHALGFAAGTPSDHRALLGATWGDVESLLQKYL